MPRLQAAVTAFWAARELSSTASIRSPAEGVSGGAAGITVSVIPFLAVGAEQKHQRRIGYEGLIITGNGQPLFQGRLCNLKDCIELLVTGGGSLAGSLKNCEAVFR